MGQRTTIRTRRDTSHGLHLVLTLLTCGMWALTGWPAMWLWHRFGPRRKSTVRTRG